MGAFLLSPQGFAAGPDYVREEQPVVDTMEDAKGLVTQGFYVTPFKLSLFPRLKRRLESLPPFWRDTRLAVKPRSYYFDRDRDIRPTNAGVDGLWLRLRHARVDQDGRFADDVRDWRAILNYEVPLL